MQADKGLSFTCFIISDDLLSCYCAQTLTQYGHAVLGIISPLDEVKSFAAKEGFAHFCNLNEAKDTLLRTNYDYLFSVINSEIIPFDIIEQASIMSINFHNSLLPKYAGLHAPSWAILNNETTHGVTWHKMVALVDAGDILYQEEFPIDSHETGLSLGIKCYQAAKSSFKSLIEAINKYSLLPKNQDLSKRSYHDFFQKPLRNGIICWQQSAESIECTFRALELGHYHHNRLGSAKFFIDDQLYIITRLHMQEEASQTNPGTIIDISSNGLIVSTTTKNIQIESVYDVQDHAVCDLESIAKRHYLSVNSILSSPTLETRQSDHQSAENLAKYELFWVRTFLAFNPILLPFQKILIDKKRNNKPTSLSHFMLGDNRALLKSSSEVLTLICIYLWQLDRKEKVQIGVVDANVKDACSPLLYAQVKPFICKINPGDSFEQCASILRNHSDTIVDKKTYPLDIFYRYPELVEHRVSIFPIIVCFGDKKNIETALPFLKGAIILTLDTERLSLEWLSHYDDIQENPHLQYIIKNSEHHISALLHYLSKPNAYQAPIASFPTVSHHEKKTILEKWSNRHSIQVLSDNVISIFYQAVQDFGSKTAIVYQDKKRSYEDINHQSNKLARYLQSLSIQDHAIIAISTEDTIDFVIALLACLKIGCAYLPLNNNYPTQQIQYILSDAKPAIILYDTAHFTTFAHCGNSQNIPLLPIAKAIKNSTNEDESNIDVRQISINSMAYIIYTSGTTGMPKGVMVPHKGISRLVKNTNYIQISHNDCMAQAANTSFDAATFEIWGALLNGAQLSCVSKDTLIDIHQFERHLLHHNVSILWLTSALFNQYAETKADMFKSLRVLLVGGDVLNPEKIMHVINNPNGAPQKIINGYGPTENTTFTTTYDIPNSHNTQNAIPIGTAISNTAVYILNKHLKPTAVGVPGELYTSGNGLALGYLNKPDITHEKFIQAPDDMEETSLLYKTGDIVCWLPDGNIQYIGRADHQVKIRGFRVELEAIHAVLMQHEDIDESAVFALENPQRQKVVVAYIVCKKPCSEISIKNFTKHHLPQYMVPEYIVLMTTMPLNENGKINQKSLPIPDFNAFDIGADYIAPRSDLEKNIAAIWEKIFNIQPIGIHHNFFELGGHSLLVTQLLIDIKKITNTHFPLHVFLENPTIENLADIIAGATSKTPNAAKNSWTHDFTRIEGLKPVAQHPINHQNRGILLTGATGFLGAQLLHALLTHTACDIYCLVRIDSKEKAIQRILSSLKKHLLPEVASERILPLVGDLSLPFLGIGEPDFIKLGNAIDTIYHNGASVHHVYSYDMLNAANVLSVIELLKLAAIGSPKKLHFISTLSAASTFLDENHAIREDFIHRNTTPPDDGYSQTKWAAEIILHNAHTLGFEINIYRPGWILGHSKNGAIAEHKNHLLLLLKGCIQLGCAPNWDVLLDVMPVDTIVAIILESSLNKSCGQVYNLVNPNTISWDALIQFIQHRGYAVEMMDVYQWKEQLKSISPSNALYPLLPLYLKGDNSDWMKGLSKIIGANSRNTKQIMQKNNSEFPKINETLLNTYFNFIEKKGFLNG